MFIINQNDELIEVDEEGTPLCPDCGANENTYAKELLFAGEDSDGDSHPISAYGDELPTCVTCGLKHPLDNCFVCGVRERMPSKYDGMMSAPLCIECMAKRKKLRKMGLPDESIFVNAPKADVIVKALAAWKKEFQARQSIPRLNEQTFEAIAVARGDLSEEEEE